MGTVYFFSLPFVHAFNFSEILIIPLIIALTMLVWGATSPTNSSIQIIQFDYLVLIYFGAVVTSITANLNSILPKNINHMAAMLLPYAVFYFGAEHFTRRLSINKILNTLYLSYLLAATYCIIEFYTVNFTTIDINQFVFRPATEEYQPTFLDALLIRGRSFFVESGHFAGYMAVVGPIVVYYLWYVLKSPTQKYVFLCITAGAVFASFSVSLFIFLPSAIAITVFLHLLSSGRIKLIEAAILISIAVVILATLSSEELRYALFTRKFEGGSFADRNQKFIATIDVMETADWTNILFGFGPGSYFNLAIKPAISVYLNFARDIGAMGVSIYILINLYLLTAIFRLSGPLGFFIFLSALLVQMYYIAIPTYFYPHNYLPIILYKRILLEKRSLKKLTKKNMQPNAN